MKEDLPKENYPESKESGAEYLEVEPGRLMHSGGFYEFFLDDEKENCNIKNIDSLHFGVSPNDRAEDNPSVRVYGHRQGVGQAFLKRPGGGWARGWGGEFTAVYKKDYIKRVLLYDNAGFKRKDTKSLQKLTQKEIEIVKKMGDLGDDGLRTSPDQIFNIKEIESIICYSDDSAKRMQKLILSEPKLSHILLHIEKVSSEALPFVKERLFLILEKGAQKVMGEIASLEKFVIESKKAEIKATELINKVYSFLEKNEPTPEIIEETKDRGKNFSKQELLEMTINRLANDLCRYGYCEAIDELNGNYKLQEKELRKIISVMGEIPMGKKLIAAEQKIKITQEDIIAKKELYTQMIQQANNDNIDEVAKTVNGYAQEYDLTTARMLYGDQRDIKNKYPDIRLFLYKKI